MDEETIKTHADSVCGECGHWHETGIPTIRYRVCQYEVCSEMRKLAGKKPCVFVERRTGVIGD